MTKSEGHWTPLSSLASRWQDYRRRRYDEAFVRLDDHERSRFAGDIGLGDSELAEAMGKGDERNELLNRMLRARRLDRNEIASREPAAMREMEDVCARCWNTIHCRNELDNGTAVAHAAEFCPNALVIAALSREFGETVSTEQA